MLPNKRDLFLLQLSQAHTRFAVTVATHFFDAFTAFVAAAPKSFCPDASKGKLRELCAEQVSTAVERALNALTSRLATGMSMRNFYQPHYLGLCEGCIEELAERAHVEPALVRFVYTFISTYQGDVPLIGNMIRGVLRPDEVTIREWFRYVGQPKAVADAEAEEVLN